MSIQSLGLGIAATAAFAVSSVVASAPAQAIDLYPGSFALQGSGNIAASKTGNTITLGLGSLSFNIAGTTGVFDTQLLAPSSGNFVSNLSLTDLGGGQFSTGPILNFITGLTLGGEAVALDLAASNFVGSFTNGDNFFLSGVGPAATLRTAISGSVLANTTISAIEFSSNGEANVQVATVPTPAAVLPVLLGMGTAALRKKKGEEAEA
jgi:hypothetical protein